MKSKPRRPAILSAPTLPIRVLLTLICLFLFALAFQAATSTATFTVTKVADSNDGVCDADCSLREAITAANANPGPDIINFNITAGAAPFVIQPTSALPTITEAVTIDGYSQPGASPNTLAVGDDAVIAIVLDGVSAGSTSSGLRISAGNSTVRGLAIVRFGSFGSPGILLQTNGGNAISGNFIGVQPDGTTGAGNGAGIDISGSSSNTIGGAAPADRNIISASTNGSGIRINNGLSTVVKGNYIGTDKSGTAALGNRRNGVEITQLSSLTVVGGTAAGEGNTIAFNQQDGIIVTSGFGIPERVKIVGNSIFSNTQLGIDLGNNGVTANDSCDADGSVNKLQNFPFIASADSNGVETTVTGFFNSTAEQTYTLDFYSNDASDASGFGEGKTYLGSTTVTTDASCKTNFSATFPVALAPDQFVTATATDSASNTSEFSGSFQVNSPPQNLVDLILTAADVPDPALTGNELTYTLTVANNGGAMANNVVLTDTLPSGVNFVSASAGCSPSGNTVTCNLGAIPPDGSAAATIVVTPTSTGTKNSSASVTSSDTEVLPADNSRTISTTVNQALTLDIVDAPDPVIVGNNVIFTLPIANTGATTANNLALTFDFPGTFVSASEGCTRSGQTVSCNIASLAGGANSSIEVAATQDFAGSRFSNATLTATNFGTVNASENTTVIGAVPNTANYVFTTATDGSLTDMSSGTTLLLNEGADNQASLLQDIGFDFYFFGSSVPARHTKFSVNSNGSLRLGALNNSGNFAALGPTGSVFPIFAPFASDQQIGVGGKVHYKTVGAAPNRILVVEWLGMQAHPSDVGGGGLTYQLRLYETSGVIEFVYGSMQMSAAGAANTVQIGFADASSGGRLGTVSAPQGGTPTYDGFTNTPFDNAYAAGAITVLDSSADGSRRVLTFTPPVPAAPSNVTFTNVTRTSLRVNWTDNASNENGFVIYRSTDGVNFVFGGAAARNATSISLSSLDANTNYIFRVFAVSESGLSQFAEGSQMTLAPGNFISTATGGNWSSPSTWTNNAVPTANDNALIVSGATVVIDGGSRNAYDVTVGGTLEFSATAAATLSAHSVSVSPGGIFRSANSGTLVHTLNLRGDLINDGTLDFSTNANTAGVNIAFSGDLTDSVFGGAGAITDVRTIDIRKNVELNPANFTVRGSTNETANGFLTYSSFLNPGTLKISGSFAGTHRTFVSTGVVLSSDHGLWLANPNFSVSFPGASLTIAGLLRVSAGKFATQSLTVTNFRIEDGAVGVGTFTASSTYTQSGGTVTAGVGATGTVFSVSGFRMAMSGGSIVLQGGIFTQFFSARPATAILDGGVVQFGNAASGGAKDFRVQGTLPNMTIDNTGGNHFVSNNGDTTVLGNVNINAGTFLSTGGSTFGFSFRGATFINNGTLSVSNNTGEAAPFAFTGTIPQTYTGSGTASIILVTVNNPSGLTIDPASPNAVITRINLARGAITNSHKLQIGQGGTSLAVVSFGRSDPTTEPGGNFDVTPSYNLGVNGLNIFYQQEGASRTTGVEIPASRTLRRMFVGNANGVILSGGDLTLDGANATADRILALEDGILDTGPNTLIVKPSITVTRTGGYVAGNLQMEYNATGSKTFHVGTANGYSPVTANVTVLAANPSSLTVSATQGAHPKLSAASSLGRYWPITETGNLTATLTFNYLQADVSGDEDAYRVNRIAGDQIEILQPPAATVDTSANTATVTGVSDFSDWTLGAPAAANQPPLITSVPPITATVGVAYTYQVQAGDPDDDPLTFALTTAPDGMTMSAAGLISWTPTDTQTGDFSVTVQVSDGRGGSADQAFTIAVAAPANQPPVARCRDVVKTADRNVSPQEVDNGSSDPEGSPLTLSLSPTGPYPAGTTTVTLTATDDKGSSSQCTAQVTINRGTPIISWSNPADIVYGTALGAAQLNATASFNGTEVAGTFAYTPAAGTLLNAGSGQTLSVSFTPDDPTLYTEATATVAINVLKATPTISVTGGTFTYDGQPHPASGSVVGINSEDLGTPSFTYNGATDVPVDAGTYGVVASFAGNENYTPAENSSASILINKAPLTVRADDKSKPYGAALPTFTASYAGLVPGQDPSVLSGTLSFTTPATEASDIGTYAITPGGLASPNYEITFADGTLIVTPAPLAVVADDKSKLYGGAVPPLTASFSGFVLGQDQSVLGGALSLVTQATERSPAGTYAITPGGLTSSNYRISFVEGTLTITKAPLTVTADHKSKLYGAALPPFTASFSGFVLGEDQTVLGGALTFNTPATEASEVGPYAITPGGLTSPNYAITFVGGTLTVEKAPLTVKADDKTKLLGAPLPAFAASFSGFVLGQNEGVLSGVLTFTTPANAASSVGTYPVTPGGLTSTNYAISFADAALTVTYNICLLYDPTKVHKSGSTIPVKLRLCDSDGRNVSSQSVIVTALGVALASNDALGEAEDAGNANPDDNFRFTNLDGSGGYIFNLKTTGLTTGTYVLIFSVAGDPVTHTTQFRIR